MTRARPWQPSASLGGACLAVVLLAPLAQDAAAQVPPSEPVRALDGRLVIGAEASATTSAGDDLGFFNYTDYENNALRMLRLGVGAELRVDRRVALLAELRTENLDTLEAYAAFVRVRPWPDRPLDLQAGRIPPVFGTFARRSYAADMPLIGMPLAYQYLTSLRADALPGSIENLVQMRGRGWLVSYPIGNAEPARGLPLVNALRWDTGVQARIATPRAEGAVALTRGALSSPRVADAGSGPQVAGRAAARPSPGLELGVSAARGGYLSRSATDGAGPDGPLDGFQRAIGADVEYSGGYWLLRGELIRSSWDVPVGGVHRAEPLRAWAGYLEARYRVRPRWYVAARGDRLGFSRVDLPGGARTTWEAPVTRVEAGVGWYLQRNLVAKAAYQHNWRDTSRERTRGFVAVQVAWWF